MLPSSQYNMLKLSKTTFPQKLFTSDCITLYCRTIPFFSLLFLKYSFWWHALALTPCPNFGHCRSSYNLTFCTGNFFSSTIVNGISVLKLFQLSNGDIFFFLHNINKLCVYCVILEFQT